ncbi:MAG: BON domain-containing protein [Smithella sp.]
MKRLAVILFFCLAMVSVAYGDLKDFTSSVKDKASSAAKETAQTTADDSSITAEVKAKILATSSLKEEKIEVSTTEGAVTLTGTVKTKQAKEAAAKIAKAVKGVKSVDNKLTVEKATKKAKK